MEVFFDHLTGAVTAPVNNFFIHTSATADLNGDGHADFIGGPVDFGNDNPRPLVILLGDGQGNFREAGGEVIAGGPPARHQFREIVIADFNGDGRSDVFVACTGQDTATLTMPGERNVLLLSAPGGTMIDASASLPDVKDFSHSAAAGDVDGDGDVDLFVGNFQGIGTYKLPYLLLNNGVGGFTLNTSRMPEDELTGVNQFPGGPTYMSAIGSSLLADLNGDGRADLVLGDHGNGFSRVYYGSQTGFEDADRVFLPALRLHGNNALALDMVAADFDSDGDLDLVLTGQGKSANAYDLNAYKGRYIQFLRNDGPGNFVDTTASAFPGGVVEDQSQQTNFFMSAMDLNGDGHQDIVVRTAASAGLDEAAGTPYFWFNDGTGRFKAQDFSLLSTTYETKTKVIEPLQADGQGGIDFIGAGYRWALFRSELALGTGPGYSDPALSGAAGFNEQYYLNENADVRTAIFTGQFGSGLAHYLAVGRAEGRVPMAPNTAVTGTDGADWVVLSSGAETLVPGAGNDVIHGGAGLDAVLFSAPLSAHQISGTLGGTATVQSALGGTKQLTGIERLQFADAKVALDLDGNAGEVARILGAVFGPATVSIQEIVGIGLSYADSGLAFDELCALALQARLGGSPSDRQVVDLLYTNVAGRAPSDAEAAQFLSMLDGGGFTPESLTALAASHPLTAIRIDLTGLASEGLAFS